jgi:hypothetical protein
MSKFIFAGDSFAEKGFAEFLKPTVTEWLSKYE